MHVLTNTLGLGLLFQAVLSVRGVYSPQSFKHVRELHPFPGGHHRWDSEAGHSTVV